MKKIFAVLVMVTFLLVGCGKDEEIILATTTSVDNSGLLDHLLPHFKEETGIKVKVVAVGTGAALERGKTQDADILIVHAKELELQFMADGYGEKRDDLMYNDFVVVGPDTITADSINDAMKYIKDNELLFYSRGDNSGTHVKEKSIWDAAGITEANRTAASWYDEVGKGMGDTLTMADESGAYTITDRSTFTNLESNYDNLKIAFESTQELKNQYGVILIPEHKNGNHSGADKFYNWLLGDTAQDLIKNYGVEKFGKGLFFIEE